MRETKATLYSMVEACISNLIKMSKNETVYWLNWFIRITVTKLFSENDH